MVKRLLVVLFAGLVVLSLGSLSFAMMCHGEESQHSSHGQAQADETAKVLSPETAGNAEDAGNKICPVSGEKIDEKTKAAYEYKGKIYNFCCPACIDEFKKDPEKYIKKIEEQEK